MCNYFGLLQRKYGVMYMKKKKKYFLYYDEAFHDRKITAKNGELNIENESLSDTFVTAVIGTYEHKVPKFEQQYSEFESMAKSLLGLDSTTEFKGTTIKKEFFRFGIQSLDKNAFKIYDAFFDLITDELIIQMSFLNKFELVITSAFSTPGLQYIANEKNFYYSLVKFLSHYRNRELINGFFNSNISSVELLGIIINLIDSVTKEIDSVPRKVEEKRAINEMRTILVTLSEFVQLRSCDKVEWDYSSAIDGICDLLKEKRILENRVSLLIDEESKTIAAARKFDFFKVKGVKSHENIGVRYSDLFSNFMGRMVKSIEDEYREDWDEPKTIETIGQKRILSENWFDISESQFNLYKKLAHIFYSRRNIYWTVKTGVYTGSISTLLALFYYIGIEFDDYARYRKIDLSVHREHFNTYNVMRESDHINLP